MGTIQQTIRQRQKHCVWMAHATEIANLSTTLSRKVGACLVRDNMILTSGYNGVPRGVSDACPRCSDANVKSGEHLDSCICIHAEINCIIQAARKGTNVDGSILYCTTKPCINCLVVLINAGVSTIIYKDEYNVIYPKFLLDKINVIKFKDIVVE